MAAANASRRSVAGTLPYGLRKRVELARAVALEPDPILLDEPMAGMNLEEKEDMARHVVDLNEELGMTVVMIEHEPSASTFSGQNGISIVLRESSGLATFSARGPHRMDSFLEVHLSSDGAVDSHTRCTSDRSFLYPEEGPDLIDYRSMKTVTAQVPKMHRRGDADAQARGLVNSIIMAVP
jgi:hypothetical protein